jgi:hypothetical protein
VRVHDSHLRFEGLKVRKSCSGMISSQWAAGLSDGIRDRFSEDQRLPERVEIVQAEKTCCCGLVRFITRSEDHMRRCDPRIEDIWKDR